MEVWGHTGNKPWWPPGSQDMGTAISCSPSREIQRQAPVSPGMESSLQEGRVLVWGSMSCFLSWHLPLELVLDFSSILLETFLGIHWTLVPWLLSVERLTNSPLSGLESDMFQKSAWGFRKAIPSIYFILSFQNPTPNFIFKDVSAFVLSHFSPQEDLSSTPSQAWKHFSRKYTTSHTWNIQIPTHETLRPPAAVSVHLPRFWGVNKSSVSN